MAEQKGSPRRYTSSSTNYLISAPTPKILAQANKSSRIVIDESLPESTRPTKSKRASFHDRRSPSLTRRFLTSNTLYNSSRNSVTSSLTSATTTTTTNLENPTAVYVRDEVYVWVPAKVHATNNEGTSTSVTVFLPDDWADTTVRHPNSTIKDLEFLDGEYQSHDIIPEPNLKNGATRSYFYDVKFKIEKGIERTVHLKDYPNKELPLQNIAHHNSKRRTASRTHHPIMMVSDMADLPFLHEAAILYNLKERHANKLPYTRVGDIVVAMNPFEWIDGLYSSEKQKMYAQHLIWDTSSVDKQQQVIEEGEDEDKEESSNEYAFDKLPDEDTISTLPKIKQPYLVSDSYYSKLGFQPHVYETSSLAYRGLALEKRNQTILVSGESGAGKTETVKIVLTHLATVERTRPFYRFNYDDNNNNDDSDDNSTEKKETVQRVLEANPVFEAFGNAKTIRNDNSSRFGRFTQLQFEVDDTKALNDNDAVVPKCLLAGSVSETYLLEKSRVVGHDSQERTYHIFYQLLAASDKEKEIIWNEGFKDSPSFAYLGDASTKSIEGVSDADGWKNTTKALSLFGVTGESFRTLMRALCIVLQLGNLVFEKGENGSDDDSSVISSTKELKLLSNLMGIEPDVIVKAMTKRTNVIRNEEMVVNLKVFEAKDGRDALAKEIYNKIFDVITRKINEYTMAKKRSVGLAEQPFGIVGLLDIFGFEQFNVNRFEQLCINYANERLQQRYVLDNFKAVQQEYEAEGIEIFDFKTVDNSGVVNLLEGKLGLMSSLNEECIRPNGSDESFVYKAKMVHACSSHMLTDRLQSKSEFGVKHFAGPVTYDATYFIIRNSDQIPHDLLECAIQSTNSLVKDEIQNVLDSLQKKKAGTPRRSSVAGSRTVLAKFRSQLNTLMANINETRTRYIRCIKPNNFMKPKLTDHWATVRQLKCAGLVTAITISRESFPNRLNYEVTWDRFICLLEKDYVKSLGGTLKEKVNVLLGSLLDKPFSRADGARVPPFACGKTRVYFRSGALERLESERLYFFSVYAAKIQTFVRCVLGRQKYKASKRAIILLQARARKKHYQRLFQLGTFSVVIIQCFWRCASARMRCKFLKENKASIVIQSRWRVIRPRREFVKQFTATILIQRFYKKRREKITLLRNLTIVAEEARMNRSIANFQAQVNDEASVVTKGDQKTVDETLLEDIEGMLEYLKKESETLKHRNAELETEVKGLEQSNRALHLHSESANASGTMSNRQIEQLQREITLLKHELRKRKKENSELRKELKNQYTTHQNELVELNDEFDEIINSRAIEMAVLKEEMLSTGSMREAEVEILKEELSREREDHLNEVQQLKEEIRRTEDSHNDYLSKLVDVLETTHASRELEANKMKEELTDICNEKDKEIIALKNEISRLHASKETIEDDIGHRIQKKYNDIVAMRNELNKRHQARVDRSSKYEMIYNRLGELIVSPLSNGETSSRTWRKTRRQHNDIRQEEDMKFMTDLLSELHALYKEEKKSHSDADVETIKRMDEVLSSADSTLDQLNLKTMLDQAVNENATLKQAITDMRKIRKVEKRQSLVSPKQKFKSPTIERRPSHRAFHELSD